MLEEFKESMKKEFEITGKSILFMSILLRVVGRESHVE